MRLINVETRQLVSFFSGNIPAYAILSHTWGPDDEEITFQDFQAGNTLTKPGIGRFKLDESCKQAKKDGFFYIWNDTCCIDKTNSTELGEAINSMFRWYKRADRCYAYLQDVPYHQIDLFPESRWFTRGWTLQELLAPDEVLFFSSEWRSLGSCKDLAPQVENATGIPQHYLRGIAEISEASVAQRMSWAATRQTKRPEDIAYSLLGIFGIAMPMIYGEGEEAFMRLQEEIMRRGADDSILAWGLEQTEGGEHRPIHSTRGVLAAAPANFKHCGLIVSGEFSTTSIESFNTLGGKVRVRLPLYKTPSGHIFGLLGSHLNHDHTRIVGIPLRAVGSESSSTYVRPQNIPAKIFNLIECSGATNLTINVLKKNSEHPANQRRHGFYITDQTGIGLEIIRVYPRDQWQQGMSTVSAAVDPVTGMVKTQRTWVRMRAKDTSHTEHLILILDLEGSQEKSSAPTPQCSLMIGEAGRLSAWDDETGYDSSGAFDKIEYGGSHAVSLSATHSVQANVVLERVGSQPMFVVKIVAADGGQTPTESPSWDRAMRIHAIQARLVLNIKSQDAVLTKHTHANMKVDELSREMGPLKRQLASVEDQIKTLEAERERIKSYLLPHETEIAAATKTTTTINEMIRTFDSREKALLEEWAAILGDQLPGDDDDSPWFWWQEDVAKRLFDDLPAEIESLHGFSVQDTATLPERLLIRAVLHGNPGIAAFAMDALGATAKSILLFQGDESTSLLEIAAARYSPAIVQTLLDREEDKEPEAALVCSVAAKHGNLEVVKAIYYSANLGTSILSLCLTQALEGTRNIPTVQLLLEKGADVNLSGFFPLHIAARTDDAGILHLLLDNGASMTTVDKQFCTPLAKAAAYSLECTKLLLSRGAVPNHGASVEEARVQQPLYMAALCGRLETVRILLNAGADPETVSGNGRRALSCAAELGHSRIVTLLLDRGADPDAPAASHHKALYLAATKGHLETVRVMCEHPSGQKTSFSAARAAALKGARRAGRQDVVDYMCRENLNTQASALGVSGTTHVRSDETKTLPLDSQPQESSGDDFWIPQATADGRLFYYNMITGERSMPPLEMQTTSHQKQDERATPNAELQATNRGNSPPPRPAPSSDASNDFPPGDPNRIRHVNQRIVDRLPRKDTGKEGSPNRSASLAETQAHIGHDGTRRAAGKRPMVVDERGVPRRDAKDTEEMLKPFQPTPSPPPRNSIPVLGSVMSRFVRR